MFNKSKTRHYQMIESSAEDVIDAIPDAICLTDIKTSKIIGVNKTMETLFELPREKLLGMNAFELAVEENIPTATAAIQELVRTGKPQQVDLIGRLGNAEGRLYWMHMSLMQDEKGEPSKIVTITRDVTERRIAQVERKDAFLQLRSVMDSMADAVFLHDLDGKIIDTNLAAIDQTGYSKEEMIGKTPLELLMDKADAPRFMDNTVRIFAGESVLDEEFIVTRKDGTKCPVVVNITMINDSSGKPVQMVSVAKDVTALKAAEKIRISESEEKFKSIFELSPVSLWEEDWSEVIAMVEQLWREGVTEYTEYFEENPHFVDEALKKVKIVNVNNETVNMFKAKNKNEFMGPEALKLVFSTPDTLPGFLGELVSLCNRDEIYKSEMSLRTLDGDIIYVLLTMIFPSGEVSDGRVLVSLMDITTRKRAEMERNRIFNLSTDILCVAGFDGFMKDVNPACERILGWSQEEFMSKPYFEFVHPDDLDATKAAARELADDKKVFSFSNRYLCKDGSYKWLEWNAVPIFKEKVLIAIARDDTKRRKDELKLKEKYKQLEDFRKATVDREFRIEEMHREIEILKAKLNEG